MKTIEGATIRRGIENLQRQEDDIETIKIYSSNDYDRFEFIEQNRKLQPGHVEKITESMLRHGFSNDGAIICYRRQDHKLIVVDGQHRFTAAKQAGIRIKYSLIDQKQWQQKMIEKNTYSKDWKLMDYLHYFKGIGIQSYGFIDDFISQYKIPLSIALNFMTHGTLVGTGNHKRRAASYSFKEGTFKVDQKDWDNAVKIMDKINRVRHFNERYLKFAHERHFLNAIYKVVTHPYYDEKRMLEHLDLLSTKLVRCVDVDSYLAILAEIFNYKKRRSSKIDFYDRSPIPIDNEPEEESIYAEQ